MLRIENSRLVIGLTIRCPVHEAWRVLTDTRAWPRWGPSVVQVACERRFIGPGSEGRVRTRLGFWVPFTITDYRERQYWSWRIGGFPATGHRLEGKDDGTCVVAFDMPWWACPYLLVCRIALGRIKDMLTAGNSAD
ncbi:MAG: SRPBCC family protein [Desulfofustis sp.]|nr:SRPBCC family protein [Desulfofustis sp.]